MSAIVDARHNKQRLERQTTTFKDIFSLLLMIFKLNQNECKFGLLIVLYLLAEMAIVIPKYVIN